MSKAIHSKSCLLKTPPALDEKTARRASSARQRALSKALASRSKWLVQATREALKADGLTPMQAWIKAVEVEKDPAGLAGLARMFRGDSGQAWACESLGSRGKAFEALWSAGDVEGGWLAFGALPAIFFKHWPAGESVLARAWDASQTAMRSRLASHWPDPGYFSGNGLREERLLASLERALQAARDASLPWAHQERLAFEARALAGQEELDEVGFMMLEAARKALSTAGARQMLSGHAAWVESQAIEGALGEAAAVAPAALSCPRL
jgi:hypothetical protein